MQNWCRLAGTEHAFFQIPVPVSTEAEELVQAGRYRIDILKGTGWYRGCRTGTGWQVQNRHFEGYRLVQRLPNWYRVADTELLQVDKSKTGAGWQGHNWYRLTRA
jgi:hypothetical protein